MRLPLRKEIHKRIKKGYCQSKWEINENELKRNWYFYSLLHDMTIKKEN